MKLPYPVESSVQVLIVGSGIIGATYARLLHERLPSVSVLMVEMGSFLTREPGRNVRNIPSPKGWSRPDPRVAGRAGGRLTTSEPNTLAAQEEATSGDLLLPKSGTTLLNLSEDERRQSGLPAAALSRNVGGMGAYWNCVTPRPASGERTPLIPDATWDSLLLAAENILGTTPCLLPGSLTGSAIQRTLGYLYNSDLPDGRQVQSLPFACKRTRNAEMHWTGVDTILGPLAAPDVRQVGNFELRSQTLCRRLVVANNRIVGAVLECLISGKRYTVTASIVVVAADSLRTPQLLWASGIRPPALGHYLNDHPQIVCTVRMDPGLGSQLDQANPPLVAHSKDTRALVGRLVSAFWIPFEEQRHPFHAQGIHCVVPGTQLGREVGSTQDQHLISLCWFCRKEIRYEDCVEFSDEATDDLGMPKMRITYSLTAHDLETVTEAIKDQTRAAAVLGHCLMGKESRLMPAGSSLHYQGTVRMGASAGATCVCDTFSQVWGLENLFVGGNGVIPSATACNPTLTSVALAIRSAERIATMLL